MCVEQSWLVCHVRRHGATSHACHHIVVVVLIVIVEGPSLPRPVGAEESNMPVWNSTLSGREVSDSKVKAE